jgi:hypothetical protein
LNLESPADPEYLSYADFPLYADIVHGSIVASDIGASPDKMKPPVIVTEKGSREGRRVASTDIPVTINITGRVVAESRSSSAFTPTPRVYYGVPNVPVYFDWNWDDDATTVNAPAYTNNEAPYAVTDADGNFSFQRTALVSDNAAFWTTAQLRLIAKCNNGVAWDFVAGLNAFFTEHLDVPIAPSTASPNISLNLTDFQVDQSRGLALRYLWRVNQFAMEDLWYPPGACPFEIDRSEAISKFVEHDFVHNMKIIFNETPQSEVAYHEFGHYLHHLQTGSTLWSDCPDPHHIDLISEPACAMNEGWAEFICAAAHAFWYARELPARREQFYLASSYQFLDGGYNSMIANSGDEEGAVARTLYNLWDDVALRAPGDSPADQFVGDNDDLDNGRPFGHPRPWLRYSLSQMVKLKWVPSSSNPGLGMFVDQLPYIRVYLDDYLTLANSWYPITYPYHKESINAMYDFFTAQTGNLRSATPTTLSVGGDEYSRTLTWNDNTEPGSFLYTSDVGTVTNISLSRNNEQGFVIWRKYWQPGPRHFWPASPEEPDPILDGRLDATFVRVGTASADATTFIDSDHLTTAGIYEYVVVAFHHTTGGFGTPTQLSIPKTRARIYIDPIIEIKRKDGNPPPCAPPLTLPPGGADTLVALRHGITGGTAHWIVEDKPAFISLQGIDSDTLAIQNNYQGWMGYESLAPFSIRCAVTSSTRSDTSLRYYPAFTPLDSAHMFVSVFTTSGIQRDHSTERGIDFVVSPNEDVISVQPLGVAPAHDSTNGYRVMVQEFNSGSMAFNEARLLVLAHPPGTEVLGSAPCGYKVFKTVNSTLVEDTTDGYGMLELPLKRAGHSRFGVVSDYVESHDSLWVDVDGGDTLTLAFDDPVWTGAVDSVMDSVAVIDTSRNNWTRDYFLELRGIYTPASGTGGAIPGVAAVTLQPEEQMNTLEESRPNPVASNAVIRYSLAADGWVHLVLYDARGQALRTLVHDYMKRGSYAANVNMSGMPAGTYFYRLESGAWSQTRSMIVVR